MPKKKVKSPVSSFIESSEAKKITKTRNVKKDTVENIQTVLGLYTQAMIQSQMFHDINATVTLKSYVQTLELFTDLDTAIEKIRSKIWKETFRSLSVNMKDELNESISNWDDE
jgi:hypothetical protein